jgi:hypothetical protein
MEIMQRDVAGTLAGGERENHLNECGVFMTRHV